MINDVLDMSKIESGKMMLNVDILSLREVMDNITNIVQSQIKAKKQIFDIFIKKTQSVCSQYLRYMRIFWYHT